MILNVLKYSMICNILYLLMLSSACASSAQYTKGRYLNEVVEYTFQEPSAPWKTMKLSQVNAAFRHEQGGSLLVNSTCENVNDAPLEVLSNDLLFGTTERTVVQQNRVMQSQREGMITEATAKVDGVLQHYALFVLKKDRCVYDVVMATSPSAYALLKPTFDHVAKTFNVLPRRGEIKAKTGCLSIF